MADTDIGQQSSQTETPRMTALRNLSNQLPVANSRVAAGQSAAQQMQLQNAVKQAPQGGSTTANAQETAASTAATQGQQLIQGAQNQIQQQGQTGQLAVGEQKSQAEANIAAQTQGARAQQMDNLQRLGQIDESAKQQLYDRQMQFQQDQNGRTIYTAEQLADYARTQAQNQEQAQDYAQSAQQLTEKNMQAMEQAYKLISEDLKQKEAVAEQSGDETTKKAIYQQQVDAQAAMNKIRADNSNRKAMFGGIGTVAGAVVGGYFGGAGGAMAGGAAGGAGGSAIANMG